MKSHTEKNDYEIAIMMHNLESQSYWSRNNVFLLVNGGLLAILTSSLNGHPVLQIMVSIIGLVMSYMWYVILIRSKDLIARWSAVIHKIEANDDEVYKLFHQADETSTEDKNMYKIPVLNWPPSRVMHLTANLAQSAWGLALGYFFLKLLGLPFTGDV